MLFENSENNRKQKYQSIYPSVNEMSSFDDADKVFKNDYTGITPEWDATKKRTKRKLDYLTTPVDSTLSEMRFKNSFGNYMMPKDTHERHRRNYALSNEALDDVVGDYYSNSLKKSFDKRREESKKRGRDEYMRYASVPGADPTDAFKASMRADDYMRVVDETMNDVDDNELIKEVAPLASYGGYDAKEYVDKFVKPSLRDRMVDEYVQENTPKSRSEYIMRSSLDNSLVGKVGSIGLESGNGAWYNNRAFATEGVANYDSDRWEDFAAGVGSLLVDMPAFSGLGYASSSLVGHATSKAAEKISKKVLSRYTGKLVSQGFADSVAKKIIKERLKNRIIQSASTQGLTLGGYDIANSVADDILHNGNVNVGKALGSYAKGFATGAAVGAVGTALKGRFKGVTGGKKLLSSAGVLSAESAVFTAGTELDKLAHGVEIKPIDLVNDFGESTATLLTMRMANWVPQGAMQKLNARGEIREELKLSGSERQEMREQNVNPDEFVGMLEKELRMPSMNSANARILKENYAMLMSNKNLSASAKSKLMYLMENKVTSTPPVVFDYNADVLANGKWRVRYLDAGGSLVESRIFPDAISAKSSMILQRGNIRKNRIAHYERELTSGMDSQNFLHEAGLYAREKGVDADMVAEAMYKSARNEKLDAPEQKIMSDIMSRSMAYESQISRSLADARNEIEQRYRLEKGALSHAVDKQLRDCSSAENMALDEYEAFVRSTAERITERAGMPSPEGAYDNNVISNEEMKSRELQEYNDYQARKHEGQGGTNSTFVRHDIKPYTIEENEPGKVWSFYEKQVPVERIKEYEVRGKEFAKKFGLDVEFITDEHQIKLPDTKDREAVMNYNNCLKAFGWVHKGKVYINLPNIKNMAELEKTMVHEIIGHAGLKKVFGNYMKDFLEELYKTSDGTVKKGIDKMRKEGNPTDKFTDIEEYLAHLVVKAYPTAQERSLLVKFKDFVRGMLVRNNILKSKYRRVSEEDLKSILKAHVRYVMNGKEPQRHRTEVFDRFSSSHLKEDGYYNREAYERDKTEMAKDESYSKFVPTELIGAKYLANYPYYPEDIRAQIVKHSKMSDEELRRQSENNYFRLKDEEDNGAGEYGMGYKSLEERLSKRYKRAQEYIALLENVRKRVPLFDKDAKIEGAFRSEFGMDMENFKNMFPTFDDFLLHKLTGKNMPFNNKAADENASYGQQGAIKGLDDLKRYLKGPLDVINDVINGAYSDEPVKLKKVSESLNGIKLTPAELREFDNALDEYTKILLKGVIDNRNRQKDPYLESHIERERERREFYRKEAEEYKKQYGKKDDVEYPN